MDTTTIALIEAIRNHATAEGKAQLAHLCTAALNGEQWAQVRLLTRLDHALDHVDTDRPDGAIAKSFSI